MTDRKQFAHPVNSCTSRQCDIWNMPDFLGIQSIVGKDRAKTLLRSFILQLGKTSDLVCSGMLDPRQLQQSAHDLKSISGQLGFEALENLCESILAAGREDFTEAMVERLLTLIDESAEAAQFHCRRLKAAA